MQELGKRGGEWASILRRPGDTLQQLKEESPDHVLFGHEQRKDK